MAEARARGRYLVRHNHPTKGEAKAAAKSKQSKLDRDTRRLSLTIIGDTSIMAEMNISVVGVRANVDDIWRVKTATHTISEQGYSTTIEAEKPGAKPSDGDADSASE